MRDIRNHPAVDIILDEESLKKGHRYVTAISHPGSICAPDTVEDRDEKSAIALIRKDVHQKATH